MDPSFPVLAKTAKIPLSAMTATQTVVKKLKACEEEI